MYSFLIWKADVLDFKWSEENIVFIIKHQLLCNISIIHTKYYEMVWFNLVFIIAI